MSETPSPKTELPAQEAIGRIRFAAETCEAAGRDENGPTPEWFRAGFLAEEVAPLLRQYADLLPLAPLLTATPDRLARHLARSLGINHETIALALRGFK